MISFLSEKQQWYLEIGNICFAVKWSLYPTNHPSPKEAIFFRLLMIKPGVGWHNCVDKWLEQVVALRLFHCCTVQWILLLAHLQPYTCKDPNCPWILAPTQPENTQIQIHKYSKYKYSAMLMWLLLTVLPSLHQPNQPANHCHHTTIKRTVFKTNVINWRKLSKYVRA